MPTYQYVCTECGGQIEAVQKFTDDPLTMHEACGGKLRKVFSPVGIVFKGSGFYRTDSRSGSSSASSSSSSAGSSSDSSGTSSAGTDKSSSSGGEKAASGSSDAAAGSSSPSAAKSSGSAGEKVA